MQMIFLIGYYQETSPIFFLTKSGRSRTISHFRIYVRATIRDQNSSRDWDTWSATFITCKFLPCSWFSAYFLAPSTFSFSMSICIRYCTSRTWSCRCQRLRVIGDIVFVPFFHVRFSCTAPHWFKLAATLKKSLYLQLETWALSCAR